MRAGGTAEFSLWKQYTNNLLPVVRWFRKHGYEMFDASLANEYMDELAERLNRSEISREYHNYMRRGALRMIGMSERGEPGWNLPSLIAAVTVIGLVQEYR